MCKDSIKVFIKIIMIFSIGFSFTSSSFAVIWEYPDEWVDYGIFFYDGTNITQLTDNGPYDRPLGNDWPPQINDSGEVVWARAKSDWLFGVDEIFFYDGTNITQLTDNDYYDESPQINDSGEVVWYAYDLIYYSDNGGGGDGGGGGCFIVTTAYGFRMPKKILTAAVFLSLFSIIFYKIRTKFKD